MSGFCKDSISTGEWKIHMSDTYELTSSFCFLYISSKLSQPWWYQYFGVVILCWELSVPSLNSHSFKLWNYKLRQFHPSVYQYLLRWSIKILIWMKSACLKLKHYVCVVDAHLCPTLCDSMNCNPPGSSVHGILQSRILGWVAGPFSRGSSRPRDWT